MRKKTKKSFADKMQKSPFMMVGIIAAAVAALIVVLSVTSGIKKGIAEKNAETTAPFTSAETAVTEAKLFNSKQAESKDVKLYDKSVRTASYAATSSFSRKKVLNPFARLYTLDGMAEKPDSLVALPLCQYLSILIFILFTALSPRYDFIF